MMAFDSRFRFGLYTLCKVSLASRYTRYPIATRVQVTNRRRIARVGEFVCISIRQVCHVRRAIRLLSDIKGRCNLGIITMFRSTTGANNSDVCIFRCQAMLSA